MIETPKHVSLDCRLLIFKIEPKVFGPPEKMDVGKTTNPPLYKQDTRKRIGNKKE